GSDTTRSRVLVLGMDGLEWDVINELMAEGKLPNFTRLIEQGTSGKFKSIRPILSPVIWTSIATGKSPSKHEITFFTVDNPKTGEQHPITSDFRKTKAVWNILSDNDRSVGVIGWWATWPAERVNGFMISDHVNYHFLHAKESEKTVITGNTYPPELYQKIHEHLAKPMEVDAKDVREFIHLEDFPSDGVFSFSDPVDHFRWAYATSESHRILGLNALKEQTLDALMIYFEGPDSVSHLFGQYYRPDPERAKTLDAQKLEQFGRVVEGFYVYMDSIIGQFLEIMPQDMNLIVCSDHGFDLKEGTGVASGGAMELKEISERAHKEYGVLFLFGPDFKMGHQIMGAHVYDIAPTVLHLLGLPIPEDMEGRLLSEAFRNQVRQV
ncbi:MAG TPA: alkaline phosphatase family protein, partial [bacterium]|nr:alkaline phosphatase family protein [bacterium]